MFPVFIECTFATQIQTNFMTVRTNNKETQIIEKASDLFMRYGFKSVTMDDVARELGISKKTLYRFFDNKLALILTKI